MLMEKMRRGVLRITTASGARYVQPSFAERLQLLWTFRNFHVLSEEVMSPHERQLMGELCCEARLKRAQAPNEVPECVIGTVERLPDICAKRPAREVTLVRKQTA